MKIFTATHSFTGGRASGTRGSVLITGLIFAIIIGITLAGYLRLTTQSLRLSHRTFFADAANNLCEAGLEEAVWSFNQMGLSTSSTVVDAAWTGWTQGNLVADTYMSGKGDGYITAPTVTFSAPSSGVTATGTANLVTYYIEDPSIPALVAHVGIAGITITNPGSGYTAAPTITLSGGGYTTAATAVARLAATRTISFSNLDQGASGTVKVWVAGYDGTAVVPNIVAKATITPIDGPPITKTIKVILSKNGVLPKGVVAKLGINWNGRPFADSFLSNAIAGQLPGVPPFAAWAPGTARDNTILACLGDSARTPPGTIDLSNGTVSGNVMTGPGVTVTGHGNITGAQIGNFDYDFTMPAYPTTAGYDLGASIPTILPRPAAVTGGTAAAQTANDIASGIPPTITGGTVTRAADTPAADGVYYYYVHGATITNLTITAGKNVVIVGDTGTNLRTGVNVPANNVGTPVVGSLKIYMDGNIALTGNEKVNQIAAPNASWAGALEVYTTLVTPDSGASSSEQLTFSGNADFVGCIVAPNAEIVGNGGGHDQADLIGSFVAKKVTSNGHMNFHFDEALGATPSAKPWGLALWKELFTPEERALYATHLAF